MRAIINAKIVLENSIIENGMLLVDKCNIAYAGENNKSHLEDCTDIYDAKGIYVGPGFVDIHSHGANGSFIYEDPEKTTAHFLSHGHTTVLSAFYDDLDSESMIKAYNNLLSCKDNGKSSKIIEGIYMEGPYMNSKFGAEAKNKKWNSNEIKPGDYQELVQTLGDFAKVWVVAPERNDIEEFVKYVKTINPEAVISVGHSEATPSQIRSLKKYGLTLQTHCMNATGRVGDGGGIRRCGPDEECFLDDNMYAEVICDSIGIHVEPDMLRLIFKIKGKDRIILITDSTSGTGEPSDLYPDSVDLNFDKQGCISGSKLTLDVACRNMIKHTGCSINDAFVMASRNPAATIGMSDEIGTIDAGKKANLVFLDSDFNVKNVMLNGQFAEELLCHK